MVGTWVVAAAAILAGASIFLLPQVAGAAIETFGWIAVTFLAGGGGTNMIERLPTRGTSTSVESF